MQNFAKRVWVAVGIAGTVLLGAWLLASLFKGLLVVFAGALFAVFLMHLSETLSRYSGWRYPISFGIVVALLVILAVSTLALLGTQIAQQTAEFVDEFRQASENAQQRVESQDWWRRLRGVRQDAQQALTSEQAMSTATSAATSAATMGITAIGGAVLVLFLGFYFALRPDLYRDGILSLVPPSRRGRVGDVLRQMSETLWWWILGRLFSMTVIGVGTTIGLSLLGVPLAVSLGVLAGLLTFMPNIGPVLSLVPAVIFSLQQGTDTAIYVVVFYAVLQFFESYFLTPMVEQHQVSLPPGATLSSQLLFSLLAGAMGLLLATPLLVVIVVLVREFYVKDILQAEPAVSMDG